MDSSAYEILLLDDDSAFVDAVQQLIVAEGYSCTGVTSPDAALERIRDRERPVRILIVDYLMVGITGVAVVEEARRIDPDLYIVLLTGFPQNMPGLYAMKTLEIDAYSKKSSDLSELLICIETGIKALGKAGVESGCGDALKFHERLRKLRVERNMTQEEIGDYIGVGRTTVVNYEQGRIRPTLENVVRLAKLFHVSCDYLMCDGFPGADTEL